MELDKSCNNLNNVEQLESDLNMVEQINSEIRAVEQVNSDINGMVEVSVVYNGSDTDSIETTVDNKSLIISSKIKQIAFDSKEDFPIAGSERLIYVDKGDKSLWRFDSTTGEYALIGKNYSQDISDIKTKLSSHELSIKNLQTQIDNKWRTVNNVPAEMQANDYIFLLKENINGN